MEKQNHDRLLMSPAIELEYSSLENEFETKVWANRDDFARTLIYFLKNLRHGCTIHLKVVDKIPLNQNPYTRIFGDKIYSVVTEQNKRDRIDLFKCWD